MSIVSSCSCVKIGEDVTDPLLQCLCKDEHGALSWKWCTEDVFPSVVLNEDAQEVIFHQRYSHGTAAVRGDTPFEHNNHYYWEIKILTRLYGTDIMVGVGTPNVEIDTSRYNFHSLLGRDAESWGFSYKGTIQHAGKTYSYGPSYNKDDLVGVHLDMWNGTLEFYLNRKPLGIAFSGLKCHRVLYPMVCSTAAQSVMKLVYAVCEPASLMLHCVRFLSHQPETLELMRSIPGLRNMFNEHFWLLLPSLRFSNYDHNDDDDADMPCLKKMFKNSSNFGKRSAASKPNRNSSQHVYDGWTDENMAEAPDPRISLQPPTEVSGYREMAWGEFPEDNYTTSIIRTEDESSIVYGDLNSDDEDCSVEEWPKSSRSSNVPVNDVQNRTSVQSCDLTAGFSTPLCQICEFRPAVTLKSLLSSDKKCLQCFHFSS